MGREREVRDAEQQTDDEEWRCKSCNEVAPEDDDICPYCRQYWEDISNGLFDQDDDY